MRPSSGPAGAAHDGGPDSASTPRRRRSDARAEPEAPGEPGVLRSLLTTVVGNVGVLALNLATGVLSARLLEPEGRGTFAAVSVVVVVAAVLGQNGLSDAATYFVARSPERARSIASTCAVMLLAFAVVTSAVALLVVPVVFRAQPGSTVDLARLAVLTAGAVMAAEVGLSLTAGLRQFTRLAVYRLLQPLLFLVGLVGFALADRATAGTALVSFLGAYVVVAALVMGPLVLGPGRQPPAWEHCRSLASYGVRLQGQIIGTVGNTRLDIAVLPAFLAATEIGHYSVAVSVASIVIALFSTLGFVVSPLASTGDREVAMRLVERTTRLVLVAASLCAALLGALATVLVTFVYGADFSDSVDPLRLLLPGCVLWGTSYLLAGGLRAMGRPGATSLAQLLGLAVTLPGLVFALPRYGIEGAAAVSTIAYATVFVVMALVLSRTSPFRARALLDVGELRRDTVWVVDAARRRRTDAVEAPPSDDTTRPEDGSRTAGHGIMGVTSARGAEGHLTRRPRPRDVMQRSTVRRSNLTTTALVAVPALVGATIAGVIGLSTTTPEQRATGVVQLSEIAGNSPSGQLNPYAADLETALQSEPVAREVTQVLGPDSDAQVEVVRLTDASRVSIALQASGEEQARAALLAAGRAGYAAIVDQQVQLLEVRERAALRRLQELTAEATAARRELLAAPVANQAAAEATVQQSERLVAIAVEGLSQVQGQLALAEELASGVGTTTAVTVEAVEQVSALPQLLPVIGGGLVGGALVGLAFVVPVPRRTASGGGSVSVRRTVGAGTRQASRPADEDQPVPSDVVAR